MPRNKTAIVVGGVINHSILIRKLQERGYYTILVDYLENPPAKKMADEHVLISTFDVEGIRDLARSRKADLIINCCLEHVNKGIAQIAEELKLPMMYSYETALNVSDKKRMKRLMKEHDIPTTDYVCVDNNFDLNTLQLHYPLFVKPADGSGSTGVNRATNPEALRRFAQIAVAYSKNGEVIIEEEAVGKECNVYCVIRNKKATVLTLSEKYSEIGGVSKVTKAIGSLWPAIVSDKALVRIQRVAQQIADAFELTTTPMFMQLKVDGDEINIVEFACRMPGGYGYQNILDCCGFDYFDFTIDAFEGKCAESQVKHGDQKYIMHSLYASPCVFDHVEGFQELKDSGVISTYLIVRSKGTKITEESANREKIGFFTVQAPTVDEALKKVRYVFEHVEAVDEDGRAVLQKCVYLNRNMLS